MLSVPPADLLSVCETNGLAAAEALRNQLAAPDFDGVIRDTASEPSRRASELVPLARAFSISPVSGFSVGAVAYTGSGKFYLGANLEFTGVSLGTTLHAEQSAVLNAWIHGEPEILGIAVTEIPCGHCRQFLCELTGSADLTLSFGGKIIKLADLLPLVFGESLKSRPGGLLNSRPVDLEAIRPVDTGLGQRALNAAQRSYTPYTRSPEGFVIESDNGHNYVGRAAESAAFNPSVPAVVCSLNQRNLSAGRSFTIRACAHARLVTALHCNRELAAGLMARISSAPIEAVLLEDC